MGVRAKAGFKGARLAMPVGIHIEHKRVIRSEEHYDRACSCKAGFHYTKDAVREAKRLRRNNPDIGPLSVYNCEFCGRWHVGKATKTILARLQVVAAYPKED